MAVKAGEVNLYFKTMADGSKKIYLAYTSSGPQPITSPLESITNYFGDDTFDSIPWHTMEGASYEVTNYGESGGVKFMIIKVNVDDANEALVGFVSYLLDDSGFVEHPDYQNFYVKKGCPAYSFNVPAGDNKSFTMTIAVLEEKVYTVLGLDGNWDLESGEELKPIDNPADGYFAQYVATFEVEADEEFKVTDGASWYGFTELAPNAYFKAGSNDNIVAKQNGGVAMTFGIFLDGTREIVIEFTPENVVAPNAYPSTQIANYLDGISVTDLILNPVMDDAEYEVTEATNENPYMTIITTDEHETDDIIAASEALIYGLYGEGFIAKEGTSIVGPVFVSPDGQYGITVSYSLSSLHIIIYNFNKYYEPLKTTYFLYVDNDWDVSADGAKFYAWVWGGDYGTGQWIALTYDNETSSFTLNNILDGAEGFKVVRFNPAAEGIPYFPENYEGIIWNDTIDYSFSDYGNDIEIHFN